LGGHDVPEETIRRRYNRGLRNFFSLYRPLATSWQMLDNSAESGPNLIATGTGERVTQIVIPRSWQRLEREFVK
jgi:predicted ABC-type ATPase